VPVPPNTPQQPAGRASVPVPPHVAHPGPGRARVPEPSRAPEPPYRGGTYSGQPRRNWRRIAAITGLTIVLLIGLGVGGAWAYYRHIDSGMHRTDPFSSIANHRAPKGADGATNILLLGSDSRDPDSKDKAGQWRTDTMIIIHIPSSHDKAYLISIPRDLYVHIPQSPSNPNYGDTNTKINAAFSWGGLPLVVETVEGYTGVRMDHVVLIDFEGFKKVTDALDGVDLTIEQDITSIHPPYRKFTKGTHHLDGAAALDYVRQRYQFAEGDFARMRHQQQFMKALIDRAASSNTLSNPLKLNAFLTSVTAAMTVDKSFSLVDTAFEFRSLRGDDLVFMVTPHLGSQTVDGASVVVPDKAKATALYKAVKDDAMSTWAAQHVSPSASTK
jgi:LCP family protein required for cell wall assembly